MINEIRIFSPATVSNVACGFDVLGFALESIGDEMIVRKTVQKGLTINMFLALISLWILKKTLQRFLQQN